MDGVPEQMGIPTMCKSCRWHPHILAPAENHTDYFNLKGFHSAPALVDHRYSFMDIYIGWPGSVHDARVPTNSYLFAKGEEGVF